MISAFGVEHEFSKSMVGGGHYIPANKLPPGAKQIIRNRLKTKVRVPGQKVEGQSAKGRQIYDDEAHGHVRNLQRKIRTDVIPESEHKNFRATGEVLLGHSRPNGKGGGILRMNPKAADQATTYKHELAHLAPKRNPVRFFERTNASKRTLGREEGRADFTAHGRRTPGKYPGPKEFQRGYDEVQRKMATGRKPKKFAVDSKGTAREVRKSYISPSQNGPGFFRIIEATANQRRGLALRLKNGRGTYPSPENRGRARAGRASAYSRKMGMKNVRYELRVAQGKQVSPVKDRRPK